MKPILTLALLLSAATALGQVDFRTVTTPQQNAEALKQSIAKHPAGKPFVIPNATYDFGTTPYIFPPNFTAKGESVDGVVLQSAAVWMADRATCFGLSDGTTLEGFTMVATCGDKQQSELVGYSDATDKARSATLRKMKLRGKAWCLYTWTSPDACSLLVDDCDLWAAYVGIMLGRSSGANAQFVTVKNCRINMDPLLSSQGGATTSPEFGGVAGIVVRGGRLTVNGCTVTATGPRPGYGPRLTAIADNFEGGSKYSVMDINGLVSKLTPGSETLRVDIDNQLGTLLVGGTGSGDKGALVIRKPEAVK